MKDIVNFRIDYDWDDNNITIWDKDEDGSEPIKISFGVILLVSEYIKAGIQKRD